MEINKIFGTQVFNDDVMRARLPEKIYKSLKETNKLGKTLDPEIADVVATAMKDWAISQGATHYTHWFQPLSNMSAGKHDSFLSVVGYGKVVSEFSSSALVKGEPDASSFPSGGLRATFEARGYTAWDPTSPAFVRDGTLYIPTAFCAYTGEALDNKTPLQRAMKILNPPALRILRALGNTSSKSVIPTVGAEQEYFLVDRDMYERRIDLKLCGRTLIGARPPKGQELDDHYCGRIRLRVAAFMRDLDEQLWKLGVPSKTKHNEVAPAQHELAPIYETVNIACDHNLLTMELMRTTAKRHGLACLLHEKPFDGINGSGKHNNFSITTDDGINLMNPGKRPEENKVFLISLCALLESVDRYADLLRISGASVGNDYRLGGNEAPPAIISVFLGESLTDLIVNISGGNAHKMHKMGSIHTGVDTLPKLYKDDNDRNRTSPFAFTGNKFEFRMLGSSQSIAFCNIVLITAIADAFDRFADRLEKTDNLDLEVANIIGDTLRDHGRVVFNGNNYSKEWEEEACRRGLPILQTTLDAVERLCDQKNIDLFERRGVLTEVELRARQEILLENLEKMSVIEAETLLYMVRREIYPAAFAYLGDTAGRVEALSKSGISNRSGNDYLSLLSGKVDEIARICSLLEDACCVLRTEEKSAVYIMESIRPLMMQLRECCDAVESIMPEERWPIPTYTDLLHRV